MKRILFLLALLLTVVFTLSSCSKEDKSTEDEDGITITDKTLKGALKAHVEELPLNYDLLDENFRQNVSNFKEYRDNISNACESREQCPKVVILNKSAKYNLILHFINTKNRGDEIYIYYPVKENVLYTVKDINCFYINFEGKEYKYKTLYNPVVQEKYTKSGRDFFIKAKSFKTLDYSKPDCPLSQNFCFIENNW